MDIASENAIQLLNALYELEIKVSEQIRPVTEAQLMNVSFNMGFHTSIFKENIHYKNVRGLEAKFSVDVSEKTKRENSTPPLKVIWCVSVYWTKRWHIQYRIVGLLPDHPYQFLVDISELKTVDTLDECIKEVKWAIGHVITHAETHNIESLSLGAELKPTFSNFKEWIYD